MPAEAAPVYRPLASARASRGVAMRRRVEAERMLGRAAPGCFIEGGFMAYRLFRILLPETLAPARRSVATACKYFIFRPFAPL